MGSALAAFWWLSLGSRRAIAEVSIAITFDRFLDPFIKLRYVDAPC